MNQIKCCPICGGDDFSTHKILWDELVHDWELSSFEEAYINRQQGHCCTTCGNNMRSMALAEAILRSYRFVGPLFEFVKSKSAQKLRVLEINEAGGLTSYLSKLPLHNIVKYPQHDITCLQLTSKTYDLIVHSDTLEHIPDPIAGLKECLRVLDYEGYCIFTVPLVVGRLSRSRQGMKDSFHGDPNQMESDYRVCTEFGSDVWKYVLEAGFTDVTLHSLEFPAALAIGASKKHQ